MAEDPTRIMRPDDDYGRRRPPQQKPHGNMRLVVAVMGAVIFGLFIALLVSGGGGETQTVTVTKEVEVAVEKSPETSKESAAEKEEKEAEGAETEEEGTGGVESGEAEEGLEGGFEEEGAIEEVAPEEEGVIEEAPVEEEGGGVSAE
jgi:hypothetical protein